MLRRLRELSRKGLQLLAESSNIGPAVVGSHALKALPAKQKTAWRPIVARLQLLRDLVAGSLVITFDLILLKCLTLLRKDINIFMLLRVFCAKRFSLRLLTAQKKFRNSNFIRISQNLLFWRVVSTCHEKLNSITLFLKL